MKHIIILFHFLISPLILSSQVSIRSYINPDTLSTDLFSINHEKGKVLIPIHPGDFTIHSYNLLEMLEDETITQVDLVYTDWPRGEDLGKLNFKRYIELYQHLPSLFSNQTTLWREIKQTGIKSGNELGQYFHGFVIYYRPTPSFTQENKIISNILSTQTLSDSTVYKVFNRNTQWKDMTVVCDVTGSMSPYLGEMMLWFKLHGINKFGKNFLFFNDDDVHLTTKADDNTGYWTSKSSDFNKVLKTMTTAMKNGGQTENNLESLLIALDKFGNESKGIIMIADNWQNPYDMRLLSYLATKKKPVHIVVCGATKRFNLNYFAIAKATGGSVHTIESDIYDMTKVSDGKEFKIGKMKFICQNGNFRQLK